VRCRPHADGPATAVPMDGSRGGPRRRRAAGGRAARTPAAAAAAGGSAGTAPAVVDTNEHGKGGIPPEGLTPAAPSSTGAR